MHLLFFPFLRFSRARLTRRLAGKTVLITGASYGIGECLAEALAGTGARLLLVARTAEKLHEVRRRVEARGGRAEVLPCDLTSADEVDALARRLLELPGGVDIVVSNAGKSIRRSLFDSLDRMHDFTRTMNLNYYGPVRLLLALIPTLVARRGQVINISAVNVLLVPPPRWAAYQASKTAFDQWLRSAGPELNARGVATTSIYLPLVRTRMIAPTKEYARMPALEPEQAASLICRAIVERRRAYAPWWMPPAELASVLLRRPWEALATWRSRPRGGGEVPMLLTKLRRAGLLSAPGLARALRALLGAGANPMALLRFAALAHPGRVAVVDEGGRLSYGELWRQAEATAAALRAGYGLGPGRRVAVACRNHAAAIKAIFASSRLGADVFLVNPELSGDQILALDERMRFDLFVHDEELAPLVAGSPLRARALPAYGADGPSVDGLAARGPAGARLPRARGGAIVVLTSGTTGRPKAASRRPSLLSALPPFLALLAQADLDRYRTLYVATPIYHGYGLAMLFVGIGLGAELFITRRFDAARACELVARHRVEAVTLVPLMLQRMLRADPGALAPLRCVIAGSAPLSPALAGEALERLGPRLFNLYGTSEAGFSIMATPEILGRKPAALGRPLPGVRASVVDEAGRAVATGRVGRLRIRSAWTVGGGWIETGDLAYSDGDGDIFLAGRADDMIVSGGENVYPIELEHVLARHPDVEAVAVVGIPDAEFGQRLKAVIVMKAGAAPDRAALLAWLRPRVARYQMPAAVEFRDELPYTPLGKPDRRALRG